MAEAKKTLARRIRQTAIIQPAMLIAAFQNSSTIFIFIYGLYLFPVIFLISF
jgi:hypothetical protein